MKQLILFVLLLLPLASFAQSATGEDELYRHYDTADKELNVVYQKLKSEREGSDREHLIEAQKAWIRFRDLNCKFKSQDSGNGGVITNKLRIACLIEATEERTKELKGLLGGF
jgi:uncharacterized protein YecT (DUF1311 family)